jgi:hypothetical protein
MTIELLHHHVRPDDHSREYGVFDGWQYAGLKPTMKEVQKRVIPQLKQEIDWSGEKVYPFLSNNPKQKHEFEKRFLECYQAYLNGEYIEIPDFDPKTGMHNKGHLCGACPKWQILCQYKNIHYTGR